MPRSPSGNYTLPPSNPVATGTTIESAWANDTMGDIANELTNSLSRNGQGGMLAALTFPDGTVTTPSIAFTAETTLGFYRGANNNLHVVGASGQIARFTPTNQLELFRNGVWVVVPTGIDTGVSPPSAPNPGDSWWDAQTGKSYIYYENPDASRSQWVQMEAVQGSRGATQLLFPDPTLETSYSAPNNIVYKWDDALSRWDVDPTQNINLIRIYEFTATAGQTDFTGTDDNGMLMAYKAGNIKVNINGALLKSDEFTATDGTTVTLAVAASEDDIVAVTSFNVADVADVYTKSEADLAFVNQTAPTGAADIPVGTNAQRPAPQDGYFRYNSEQKVFEGYSNGFWGSIGGGATGGGTDAIFHLNDLIVTTDYSIPADKNAGTFGAVTIDTGVTVTVPATSTWSIV